VRGVEQGISTSRLLGSGMLALDTHIAGYVELGRDWDGRDG